MISDQELDHVLARSNPFPERHFERLGSPADPTIVARIMATPTAGDPSPQRPSFRRRTTRVATLAAATVAVVGSVSVVSNLRDGTPASIAWAAAPEPVTAEDAAALQAACDTVAADDLGTISTIDLRGGAALVVYEQGDVWQLCVVARDGDDAADPAVVTAAVPEIPTGREIPTDATGTVVEIAPVLIDGTPASLVVGRCFGPRCEGRVVELTAGAIVARTAVSADGTFAAWTPSTVDAAELRVELLPE